MRTFTQNEIADFLGVKQPTVSKYFTGKLEISAKTANKLHRKFGIPFDFWDNPKSQSRKNDTKEQSTPTSAQHTEEVS